MEKGIRIQSFGGVAKEETVYTLSSHIMANTFVLETEEPYPGYHGKNLPGGTIPISIFLMTRVKYSIKKILRISASIKKYFPESFDAVSGELCLHNETIPCIRLRSLKNYESLEDLQKSFYSEGIRFLKKRKVKTTAVITLNKVFDISQIEEGIYKDNDESSTFYLRLSNQLSYEKFRQLTRRVRNNVSMDSVNFDAALAAIYTREILDVVRIYSLNTQIEKLRQIQIAYEEELKTIL